MDTRMETVEEIRQLTGLSRLGTQKDKAAISDTAAFRPVARPPMLLLCILDDGSEDGEWWRVRKDKVVIGREDGDIRISHDGMMSSKHAELTRTVAKGAFRWHLTDLGSTNGTFIRVADSVVHHGQEILLGSRRYRFNAAAQGAAVLAEATRTEEAAPPGTRGWKAVSPHELLPSLTELTPEGEGRRVLLTAAENWLGRDSKHCNVILGDDPMLSPRHASLRKDLKGKWKLENAGSRNGTWIRISKIPVDGNGQFQLGEQRFIVRVQS